MLESLVTDIYFHKASTTVQDHSELCIRLGHIEHACKALIYSWKAKKCWFLFQFQIATFCMKICSTSLVFFTNTILSFNGLVSDTFRILLKITQAPMEFILHKTAAWDLTQDKQVTEAWWLADTSLHITSKSYLSQGDLTTPVLTN